MAQSNSWWKTVFQGHLAAGINEDKVAELADERFLYFQHERQEENSEIQNTMHVGNSYPECHHLF